MREVLAFALRLNVYWAQTRKERFEWVLNTIGLHDHQAKKGVSKWRTARRLGLQVEQFNDPACMVCDEYQDRPDFRGLHSTLLRNLVQEQDKTFLHHSSIPSSTSLLRITVVHHGNVIFRTPEVGNTASMMPCSSMVSCTSRWNTGRTFGQHGSSE